MNGLSRRKACLTCSSKKRRCDMLYPACTRCTSSGNSCVYTANTSNPIVQQLIKGGTGGVEKKKRNKNVLVTPGISFIEEKTTGTATVTNNDNNHSYINDSGSQTSYLFKIINSTPPTSPAIPFTNQLLDFDLDIDETVSSSFLSNTPSTNNPSPEQLLQTMPSSSSLPELNINTPPDSVEDFSISPPASAVAKIKQFKHFSLNYRLMQDTPFSEEASALYIRRIKQYPKLFLKNLKTAFIHPSLYPRGYPPVLLTALSICALSTSDKYQENENACKDRPSEAFISTSINRSINQLVDSISLPLPVVSTLDIREKLAIAQALLLTQCIRLYSGDIKQVTQAEKVVLPLTAIFDDLVDYIHDSDGNPKHSDTWDEWILIHSIGRTCFLGAFTQGFYYYLREQPEYNLVAPFMPMTLSRSKWQAASQVEFDIAKNNDSQQYDMTIAETYIIFSTINKENFKELCYESLLMLCFCLGVEKMQSQFQINIEDLVEN